MSSRTDLQRHGARSVLDAIRDRADLDNDRLALPEHRRLSRPWQMLQHFDHLVCLVHKDGDIRQPTLANPQAYLEGVTRRNRNPMGEEVVVELIVGDRSRNLRSVPHELPTATRSLEDRSQDL